MKRGPTRMMTSQRLALPLIGLWTALVAGCERPSFPTDASANTATERSALGDAQTVDVAEQLGQLRAKIGRLHSDKTAFEAEYTAPLTSCVVDEKLGGMGFHFGKPGIIDGTLNELEPEVLLYEPQKGGLQLVAAEFIIPYEFAPKEGPAPTLFGGREFTRFDDNGVWGLHAWVFKNNPRGVFANFNPAVNCDAVPASSRMSHNDH